jgi:hypothetical protein
MKNWVSIFVLLMVCSLQLKAQYQLPRQTYDELLGNARGAIDRMSYGLMDLGNTELNYYQKQDIKRVVMYDFLSTETSVVNDIDPIGNTGETIKLEVYLENMILYYDKYGLDIETKVVDEKSDRLYEGPDGEFLFVKLVCERTISGKHNLHGEINKSLLLDYYVWFRIENGDVIAEPIIYSCNKHMDDEGQWTRVLIKEEMKQVGVSSTKRNISQAQAEPPKPTKEIEAETTANNTVTRPSIPCSKPNSDAYFISPSNSQREWLFYYENSEVYKKAIGQKITGRVSAQVVILATGEPMEWNIKTTILEGANDEHALIRYSTVIQQLVRESKGWMPAMIDCKPVADTVTLEVEFSNCTELITNVKLNGNGNIKHEWKRYVGQHPRFMQAVFKEDVRGPADVSFEVGKSGTVTAHSIETNVGHTLSNQYNGMKTLDALVLGSDKWKSGWWPRVENCTRTDQKVKLKVKFKPRWVDPRQVADSNLFSGRKKKKWKNRAEWADWKDEKIGGVHFSIGALWASPLSLSRNYEPFQWSDGMLGFEASLGGMFGQVGGLELRYRFLNPRNEIGLGLLFNASPKRWPARFYFPIHFNVSWNNDRQIFLGPSLGLICLDLKVDKKVSLYFNLIHATAEFGTKLGMINDTDEEAKATGLQAFYYTPSIGLRFCRW